MGGEEGRRDGWGVGGGSEGSWGAGVKLVEWGM